MSQQNFLKFILANRENIAMLTLYSPRNLSQLLFHAKNEGFEFTLEDIGDVIGKLEADVILKKDGDPFDGSSRLWRQMWGEYYLEYIVNHLVGRYTDQELWLLIGQPK